jgi:hypothetical protein
MKTCIKCNEIKEISLFPRYKNRKKEWTYTNVCKTCTKKNYKDKYYEKNREVCLERSKKQKQTDPEGYKQYLRDYYQENIEYLREKGREYQKQNRNKANERLRKYRRTKEGNIKEKARSKVQTALRNGSLIRPSICEDCKKDVFVEAHHEDYSKPLDIQWLCKDCHWKRHSTHHLNEGN